MEEESFAQLKYMDRIASIEISKKKHADDCETLINGTTFVDYLWV